MKKQFQSKSVPRGTRTIWRYLGALFLLFTFAIGNVWAVDYSPLNYNGGSELPSGYKYYGSSTGVENKSAFSIGTYQGHTVFDVTAGGTGAYNKRAIEFTVSEDCTLDIEFYVGGDGRILNLFHGNSTVVHSSTGTTKGDYKYTFSYSFENIKSDQTYSLSGSGSKVYISKITFTPAVACTETAPTSVAVSGGATYDKGDALSNLSAAVTGGTGTMSYQWYRNTTNAATVSNNLKLANCTTATLAPSNKVGTYYYYCVASNCAGSVTSGTTSVTINADCSATGDIFTLTMNSENAPTSEVKTPASSTMNIDKYINIDGGDIVLVTGSSQHSSITTTPRIKLGGSSGYAQISLDCPLQEGDKITFEKTNKIALAADASGTNKIQLASSTNEYTITKEDCLYNQSNLFILRDGNNVEISSITITRPVMRTISFDSNGGSAVTAIKVEDGTAATKPADPTWAHHRFDGWYDGSDPYDWSETIGGDLTLTAHWTQLYTITYAAGDGTATGDAPTQIDKAAGEKFTVAANTFAVAGKDFDTWNDGTADVAPNTEYTMGSANVVLTAKWKTASAKYTVVFKDGDTELGTKLFDVSTNPSDADIDKTKPMFTFAAWQKDEADIALDDAFWTTVVKDATVTLTARWEKLYASTIDIEEFIDDNGTSGDWATYLSNHGYAISSTSDVSLDGGNSGNKPADKGLKIKKANRTITFEVVANKVVVLKVGSLKGGAQIKVNEGEYADLTGASPLSTGTSVFSYYYSANVATYTIKTSADDYNIIQSITIRAPYQVTFDANGGEDVASLNGTPSVTLPSATKGTDSFLGWFDAAEGGNKIGEAGASYTPTADIELFAHWEAVSTDARLASITFSATGTLSPAFNPEVTSYTYTMPYGTAAIPTITGATSVNAKAKAPVIDAQAANWGDVAHIHGVAQSDDTKDYYITMLQAPKDGVEIIGVVTTGGNNKTVSGLYKGDATVNLDSNKKLGEGRYIYVTLASGYTFEETDVLVVDVAAKSDLSGGNKALEITTGVGNIDGAMWKSIAFEDYTTSENTISLTGIAAGQTSIGLKRSANQNAYINGLKVYRPMNPILTAITINGVDCEKGTGNAFSVILPNGTNLGSLTVVPTIVKNGEGGSAAPTAAWAWEDNTYRVTDKDGDYTDYTITLTEAAAPSAAPEITTQPEGADYIEGASIAALEVVATGSGELSYQWYLGAEAIEGATAATYDPAVSAVGSYVYHCVVTNTEAGHPATSLASNNATITIEEDPAAIKLVGATGAINTTDFITGVAAGTVNFDEADHNCAVFGNANITDITSCQYLAGMVQYNARTNKTKVKLDFYSTSGGKKAYLFKMVEGGNVETIEIDMPTAGRYTTEYYTFNSESNRSIYVGVSDRSRVNLLQMKVIDDGATTLKRFGEADYSLNLNKSRLLAPTDATVNFEGMTVTPASHNKVNYSTYLALKSDRDPISFTIAAPVTMTVVNASSNKYYVSTSTTDLGDEYGNGSNDFDLTAGTWYIVPKSTSAVQLTNIAFAAPYCQLAISGQPETNTNFGAGNLTATVVAASTTEGAALAYQWYNASDDSEVVGANEATLTTTTPGEYYVVVTASKAGYQNKVVQSNTIELGYRDLTIATLSALSYGGNAIALEADKYEYRVDLAENTTEVPALAATATQATYGATAVPTDATEFISYEAISTVLVTAEDGTTTQTYTVHFYVDHMLSQVNVTGTTTWNWINAAEGNVTIKVSGSTTPVKKDEEGLMANVRVDNNKPTNDATFNSQALLFYGENVRAKDGGRWYASVGHIKFTTTVAGMVEVEYSDNGTNNRRVKINNALSESSASKTDVKIFAAYMPAGEITIMGVNENDTEENKYVRISKIRFVETADAEPSLARTDDWLAYGELGTICIPQGAVAVGADIYELVGKEPQYGKIVFETVEHMKPGKPYLFQAKGDRIDFILTDETPATEPDNSKAMKGTFEQLYLTDLENVYYFADHALWSCDDLTSLSVPANRAYVKMDEVQALQNPNPAPGRRRVVLGVHGEQVVTGVENLNASEQPIKLLINGQIFILRGEKLFDATGRLVK